jgi:hypothetical protein
MPFLFMALGVLLLYGVIGLIVWGYCREDVVAIINDEAVNQSKDLGRWRIEAVVFVLCMAWPFTFFKDFASSAKG